MEIKYLDFGTGADGVELEVKGKGVLHIRQKDRSITADIDVDSMDDFTMVRAAGHFQGGILPVRIFIESEAMDIRGIKFIKDTVKS